MERSRSYDTEGGGCYTYKCSNISGQYELCVHVQGKVGSFFFQIKF
jgi:hypothetical protein